jgi:hypothetical protein
VEHAAQEAPIRGLRCAHVRAVGLDAAAKRDVSLFQRRGELWQLRWRRRHVGVREHDEVAVGREHAGSHCRTLPGVGHRHDGEGRGVGLPRRGALPDEVRGPIRAAIVDHQHIDSRSDPLDRGRVQIIKQLVKGGADPALLVIGRQHDGHRPGAGLGGRRHLGRVYRPR